MTRLAAAIAAALAGLALAGCARESAPPPDPGAVAAIEQWQDEREERLRESIWLQLVGLHWLEPGEPARFGSAPDAAVAFPAGAAPAHAGTLRVEDGTVVVEPAPGAELTVAGEPVTGPRPLAPDTAPDGPDRLGIGRLTAWVIERDGRFALRVADPQSPTRRGFTGLEFFPPDPAWQVPGRYEPFDEPHAVEIPTTVGTTTMNAPGELVFEVDGDRHQLTAFAEDPFAEGFFVVFSDRTSGESTYGAGRFLSVPPPGPEGEVVIDFNRAYNPPCAFSAFATCPLPPPENRLPVAVTAGERRYAAGH
jgi:hypothetical protein